MATKRIVTDRVALTEEDLAALKRGESVFKKRGSNIMGDDLVIKIARSRAGRRLRQVGKRQVSNDR